MRKGDIMSSGFVLGKGRTPLNIKESSIRYAIKNSKSNSAAARFLNVSLTTYEKYSKQYIDDETGKNLWDLHKNRYGVGVKKPYNITKGKYALKDILEGKYPDYAGFQLKKRLLTSGYTVGFPCKCHNCNYDERRITDNKIPLVLDHIDEDWTNHVLSNLRFLCYNCYFNLKGNLRGAQPQWRIEQIIKAKKTIKLKKAEQNSDDETSVG